MATLHLYQDQRQMNTGVWSVCLLCIIQPRTLPCGMVPPTFGLCIRDSVNPIKKTLQRHDLRFAYQVILDSIHLTITISHYSFLRSVQLGMTSVQEFLRSN